MSRRRACALFALLVAMLAVATMPAIGASGAEGPEHVTIDVASTVHAARTDGTIPHEAVSDRARSDRTLRSSLVLLAVLVALLWLAADARRAPGNVEQARRAAGSRWSPVASRAPPSFRIA